MRARHPARISAALATLAAISAAQQIPARQRVSLDFNGTQGNAASPAAAISANGRFVAFESVASNLVPGDTNGPLGSDIFVKDRFTGAIERVSVDNAGVQGNGPSVSPCISADGRMVAFASLAGNLVVGDTPGTWDVFVRDRQLGVTVRASVDSHGNPGSGAMVDPAVSLPAISADGRIVTFASWHTDLVPNDVNGTQDVFAHDLTTGATRLVSVATGGTQGDMPSARSALSSDGRFVAFESQARTLVPPDPYAYWDVFLRDLQSGTTRLMSTSLTGHHPNSNSSGVAISGDGLVVAFSSPATDLAPDPNVVADVFTTDVPTGVVARVSLGTHGEEPSGDCTAPALSGDGRFVAFQSESDSFLPSGAWQDVFVLDRASGTLVDLSQHADSGQAVQDSLAPSLSADGQILSWVSASRAISIADINETWDVFVTAPQTGPAGTGYGSGKVNSGGCAPMIVSNGYADLGHAFYLTGLYVRPDRSGLLLYGINGATSTPFSGGTLYVAPPLHRTPATTSQGFQQWSGPCNGTFSINMRAFGNGLLGGNPIPELVIPGTVVNCQWWGRDAPGFDTQLTNALQYTVFP